MEPWEPWDAEDDEVASLRIIREGLPGTLEQPILLWLRSALGGSGGNANHQLAIMMQSALRTDLGVRANEWISTNDLVQIIHAQGPRFLLQVVDWLLAMLYPYDWTAAEPREVATLGYHLDVGYSSATVAEVNGQYRLKRRIPVGVEEAAQEAINESGDAGKLLAQAWRSAYALDPNPSEAMVLAVRAVEAAAAPVVVPNSKKGFLGEIAQTIQDQRDWELILWRDDEQFPDHGQLLVLMLRTLAKAQANRHGKGHSEPTPEEARAHVQLAATLVSWFSSGSVRRAG